VGAGRAADFTLVRFTRIDPLRMRLGGVQWEHLSVEASRRCRPDARPSGSPAGRNRSTCRPGQTKGEQAGADAAWQGLDAAWQASGSVGGWLGAVAQAATSEQD
jgi:hypothetical protein